ncbi:MAG: SRPBCC domain-containing protein [Nocardiopsaceae bacterium]|jgi:uncharacterized protein YndB with AHSA1/START domain|nr:SRPBCC domain-containing protein [Nocardiopsaceae bacterium]
MRSTTAHADIGASPGALWSALTTPDETRHFFQGLRLTSAWQPDARVDAHHGTVLIATGTVVVADEPALLVYRLDEPGSGDLDCWLGWRLAAADPGITRVTLTADTLPCDPPVDTLRLLSGLKTYLETGRPLGPARECRLAPGRDGRPAASSAPPRPAWLRRRAR